MSEKLKLVSMIMSCQLCGKSFDSGDLKWILMTNKVLNMKMLIEYGKREHACPECIERFDLPLYNWDKKVTININRTTRAALRELYRRWLKSGEWNMRMNYDDVIGRLIRDAGYGYIFDEVDENKIILRARKKS